MPPETIPVMNRAEIADTPLVDRPDLAEVAVFHLSFAIGCIVAGAAFLAIFQPPGVGWQAARDAGETTPVVTKDAFEGWAGRLLVIRSATSG